MKFLQRALRSLGTIYRFEGPKNAAKEVDLASPIALVHDVSREVEIATGYFLGWVDVVVATPGNTTAYGFVEIADLLTSANVTNVLRDKGLEASNVDVWLIDANVDVAAASVANFDSAQIAARVSNDLFFNTLATIAMYSAAHLPYGDGVTLSANYTAILDQTNELWRPKLPMRLGDDGILSFRVRSAAGGATTATANYVLWVGARDVLPPGLA